MVGKYRVFDVILISEFALEKNFFTTKKTTGKNFTRKK